MSDLFGGLVPQTPKMPAEPILRTAEVDGIYRWELRRAWGPGPAIMWCGLNPSTADGTRDDPTMLREIGFSYRWGFGSLVKVNIYPFISSSPAAMREWLKTAEPGVLLSNALRIADLIPTCDAHVAAWGKIEPAETVEFVSRLALDAASGFTKWKCLGTNSDGTPRHTLARGRSRVPDDTTLVDYDVAEIVGYG